MLRPYFQMQWHAYSLIALIKEQYTAIENLNSCRKQLSGQAGCKSDQVFCFHIDGSSFSIFYNNRQLNGGASKNLFYN